MSAPFFFFFLGGGGGGGGGGGVIEETKRMEISVFWTMNIGHFTIFVPNKTFYVPFHNLIK